MFKRVLIGLKGLKGFEVVYMGLQGFTRVSKGGSKGVFKEVFKVVFTGF